MTPPALFLDNFSPEAPDRQVTEQFLRCFLEPDTLILLPMSQLVEVLNLAPGQVTPIPHLPPWVTGVYNWRGEVLWLVDLGHLLGLVPWQQQPALTTGCSAVIIQPQDGDAHLGQNQALGLIVTQVQDIESCDPGQIQSPPATAVTPEVAPFLRGYWLKRNGEILACLDGDAIFAAMPH